MPVLTEDKPTDRTRRSVEGCLRSFWVTNLQLDANMDLVNQHYVNKSYLRAWRDPDTPNGAFVWAVDKGTKKIRRKSPKSLFSENDFYTVLDDAGDRILELEEKLSIIEGNFISLRKQKLQNREPLELKDRLTIALFASTLYARTKFQKVEQQEMWQSLLDSLDDMPIEMVESIKKTPNYDVIVKLREQPMPFHMFNFVNMAVPYLLRMNCAILETINSPGFITSDNPCSWIDPSITNLSLLYKYPFGLGSPNLLVSFPVSPNQSIHLESKGPEGYKNIDSDPNLIDLHNQSVVQNADKTIVVNRKEVRDAWFI